MIRSERRGSGAREGPRSGTGTPPVPLSLWTALHHRQRPIFCAAFLGAALRRLTFRVSLSSSSRTIPPPSPRERRRQNRPQERGKMARGTSISHFEIRAFPTSTDPAMTRESRL